MVFHPCRAVALELQANREPDFDSLVPSLSPRKMASRVFYLLLGECGYKRKGADRPEAAMYTVLTDLPSFLNSAVCTEDPSRGTRKTIWSSSDSPWPQVPLSKFIKPYLASLNFACLFFKFIFKVYVCPPECASKCSGLERPEES